MIVTKINGKPLSKQTELQLRTAIQHAHIALTTHRLNVPISTLDAAQPVIDACNNELFRRLLKAEG